jgi:2-hydroxy-3-oxopropionate reductase
VRGAVEILVGGEDETFEQALPILNVMGERIIWIGKSGAGQMAKACHQIVVGGTIALVAEALVLASKSGTDPRRVREALFGGLAGSRHGERMLSGAYEPRLPGATTSEEHENCVELAREQEASAPMAAMVAQIMNVAAAHGGADLDHAAVALAYEKFANTPLREPFFLKQEGERDHTSPPSPNAGASLP